MNLGYWGVKMPVADTSNDPARALPVMDVGPMCLKSAGGSQVLSPTDSTHKTLTVPTGATYAKLQVNGSAAWFTTDGVTPVIASNIGFKVADLTVIELWGPDDLAAFKILAHTGGAPKVYVEYGIYTRVIND